MLLNDRQIRDLGRAGFIEPYHEQQVSMLESGHKVVSYGISSFGYDVTLASEFKKFIPYSGVFDIHNPSLYPKVEELNCQRLVLQPGEMVLAKTFEWLKIPRNCLALCIGKSTWARQGLIVNTTPIEPEWMGHITLELSNISNCPIAIYAFEGIAQLLFFVGENPIRSYADKNGKYQNQIGVTEAKL